MDDNQRRLLAHHGGAHFHDLMLQGFERRFDADFWKFWDAHVPAAGDAAPTWIDFGCGPGLLLQQWRQMSPSANLHGVELQPYMLDTAKRIATEVDATLHEADLHTVSLPLPDDSVDAIVCSVVVHEMREPIGMFREIRRLLGPSGRLLLTDWVRVPLPQYLAGWDDDPLDPAATPQTRANRIDHFMEHNKFSREDLRWLMERTGLVIEDEIVRGDGQFVWFSARA